MCQQIVSRRRLSAALILLACASFLIATPHSSADLNSRAQQLQQSISADNGRIQAYQGKLSDLRARLSALESSLAIQRALLRHIQDQLAAARSRLALLVGDLSRDRRILAAQLVAQYESPPPTLVGVALEAHGFSDLLNRMHQMRAVAQQNARAVKRVMSVRREVARETARLTEAQIRQRRVTSAVLVERDQVASIQLAVLSQERVANRDRARKQSELRGVQRRIAVLQARAAAAQQASFASGGAPVVGFSGGGFVSHGGEWGFFPAPGTNYSVGNEPAIAARLDALGKALHLHLIGISGYRSPAHSVEVGGFADDPHTRGEASDTPGVEGVPESTLLRFGLTRPFPGPAEADHIQLA